MLSVEDYHLYPKPRQARPPISPLKSSIKNAENHSTNRVINPEANNDKISAIQQGRSAIMIFRQLFDLASSTYTYILGCEASREALIIDAVFEQHHRDTALLRELDLKVKYAIDTHVHADHVTGAWLMKHHFQAPIVLSEAYAAKEVDVQAKHGTALVFGDYTLMVRATPGHTNGCLTFVTQDETMAFTGDCLMIRGAGRTDFQAGSVHTMWQSIREQIFTLPDSCLIYPGHDYMGRTVSTVGEEKHFNPRIGGDAREEDFAGYMNNLGLPHPRLLEIAVPANLHCGRPRNGEVPPPVAWGPVTNTFAGIPEVEPNWVARHLDAVYVLDVRSAAEFGGDLGHIDGSTLIPLDELRERHQEITSTKPIVTVCQSGKRSAMATQILNAAGFSKVANIPGGLLQWSRLALPGLILEPPVMPS
ncbi:MAG: sulfur dioxygenase [Candidatus Pseudothioglobus sp.]|jgi:glyoxylase-like metal-dependent hydrolase (beta-lactamase superfamily II)/rhodanese-related sulfurtransferase